MYTPIISTLGFIVSPDKASVLMVHRTYKAGDEQHGKYNGIGGKLERNEDVAAGMMREVREETNLAVTSMTLRGTVNWVDFGPSKQDWLAFVFLIDGCEGEIPPDNDEGALHWVALADMHTLPMWQGDKLFLDLVFDADPRPFHGYMRYDGETPAEWSFTRM